MHAGDLIALFDQQAEGYDARWARTAPVRDALHLVVGAAFSALPDDARVLCVGVGTGAEVAALARQRPGWRFTALDPSGPMLGRCRERAEREGIAERCTFHQGNLASLPAGAPHDAATCFLVSQFLLDRAERVGFFRAIAERLRPSGLLANADLASGADAFDTLLRAWLSATSGASAPEDAVARARATYSRDVSVLPPEAVASILADGGFPAPVRLFQTGLLHAWIAAREA